MAAASLTSDHVNYLVWRYLQESGHGESAVKLQRDWREDPQDLPFAPFIRTHALVTLMQKGLQYHEIEHSIDQNGEPVSPSKSADYFGPGSRTLRQSPERDADEPGRQSELVCGSRSPRKHARLSDPDTHPAPDAIQPPAPKRSRRSSANGLENGEAMEIDSYQGTNGSAQGPGPAVTTLEQAQPEASAQVSKDVSPAPAAETQPAATAAAAAAAAAAVAAAEPAPSPSPTPSSVPLPVAIPRATTNGSSVGTQVDKIAELGAEAETTYLDLGKKNVLHCAWSPAHPTSLLTAGTEALARIWTLARPNSSDVGLGAPPYIRLHQVTGDDERWMVTAVSWSQDGEHVAVGLCDSTAVYDGSIFVWSRSGQLVNVLPVGQYPILCLRWNVSGTVLLGLGANVDSTSIMLWDPMTADSLDSIVVDAPLEDAAWVHESGFIVTGGNALQVFRFEGHVSLMHSYKPTEHDDLWLVRHDSTTGIVATCTHNSTIHIYDQRELLHSFAAHSEPITALEWQPLSNPRSLADTDPRLLASSSLDGSIRIWNGRAPWPCIHHLTLGRAHLPVMALSFSPDGFALAAASSHGKILVWNAKEGGSPLAAWSGAGKGGMKVEEDDARMLNGDSAEGDGDAEQHSLSWDADGRKLAYGVGQQVAIINFRR